MDNQGMRDFSSNLYIALYLQLLFLAQGCLQFLATLHLFGVLIAARLDHSFRFLDAQQPIKGSGIHFVNRTSVGSDISMTAGKEMP